MMQKENNQLYNHIKQHIKIVADTHFFHNKAYVIYDERCEPGEEETYFKKQVNNLKTNIHQDDFFISLGDNIFNNAGQLTSILDSIKCIKKFSCIGNHDKSPVWLTQHGFDLAAENLDLKIGSVKYIFCHYPPRYAKYMEIIKQNPNTLIISGHIHYDTHLKIQNRMICLPPDRVYTLAEIDQLFDNLPLARGVWNGKGGYISSLDLKKLRLKNIHQNIVKNQPKPVITPQLANIIKQTNIPVALPKQQPLPILTPSEKKVLQTRDVNVKKVNFKVLDKTLSASKQVPVGKTLAKTTVETSGNSHIKKQINNFIQVEHLNKTKGVQLGKLYVAPKGEYDRSKQGVVVDITNDILNYFEKK